MWQRQFLKELHSGREKRDVSEFTRRTDNSETPTFSAHVHIGGADAKIVEGAS
jgi:hypothetical protein